MAGPVPVGAPSRAQPSTGALFSTVWSTLSSVLGTMATAALLRRALAGAVRRRPELRGLDGLEVRAGSEPAYVLPRSWEGLAREDVDALAYVVRSELCPLLRELTGPVLVDLLGRQSELCRYGVLPREERA